MITEIEAFLFLEEHQPMPNDDELNEDEIQMYEQVRRYFIDNPDERCVSLFLNSFGGRDGFGVYQMVEDVILMYDEEKVLPHILKAFNSSYDSIKYWCIQISSNFPNACLFEPLVDLLKSEDEDLKLATIDALAQLALSNIKADEIIEVIREEGKKASNENITKFVGEILQDIQNNKI